MKKYTFNFAPYGITGGEYVDKITVIADSEDDAIGFVLEAFPKSTREYIGKPKEEDIKVGIIGISYDYP